MRRLFSSIFFTLALLSLGSCSRDGSRDITLDPTPVLSGGLGWGVVTIAYTRLLVEPRAEADQSAYARRGEVMEIVARARNFEESGHGLWYRVSGGGVEGWIHEAGLRVFPSRERALNAPEARP